MEGVVQSVDLREEYDLICAELDLLTQENLMGATAARDVGAAMDDSGNAVRTCAVLV